MMKNGTGSCGTIPTIRGGLIASLGFLACANAQAIGPEVIYTKIPTHPSSIVPGALDLAGQPAVTNFRALEILTVSPDGSTWAITARTQQGSDLETITLIGSGTSGTTLLQEGQPVPGGVAGELVDFFGSGFGRFDDANRFAMSLRARGGASTVFQKVLVYTGDTTPAPVDWTLIARGGNLPGGDLYTGLSDLSPAPSGDETIGNSIGSIHILNNGVVGAQDSAINMIHTSRRPAIFYTSNAIPSAPLTFGMFQQTGVTTFLSMDGSINHTYETLGANTFYTTPDGGRWLVQASILGAPDASDAVLVVDGRARMQEGSAIGPSSAIMSTVVTSELASNGDWFARGARVGGGVYATRNAELVIQTGDPVSSPLGPPTENWGATFLTFTGNAQGDWILVGKTDNTNLGIDDVVVYNGEVVMREGDPIDLDNNGQYDDNVFIGRGNNTMVAFETNDAALTDDGMLYIFVNLRDGQGNDLNSNPSFGTPQALVRLDLTPVIPCLADIFVSGEVDLDDLLAVINTFGSNCTPCKPTSCVADVDDDCDVDLDDLLFVINGWGPCD